MTRTSYSQYCSALTRWKDTLSILTPQTARVIARYGETWGIFGAYILQCSIVLRRMQLFVQLQRLMPGRLAWWLAEHWPEWWLPGLDVSHFADATDEEETE